MRKSTTVWLVTAIVLILIGAGLFTAVLWENNWDFGRLNTMNFKTETYTSFESFADISIDTTTADITFLAADGDCTKVVCYEMEKVPHSVQFSGGKLIIEDTDQRKWYEHIGINFSSPKITVYLPKSEYGDLHIETTTGDISIPAVFRFENIGIDGTTGDIECSASVTGTFAAKLTTGDITVERANIGSLDLTSTMGDITVSNVTCMNDIHAKVSTGKLNLSKVNCSNLSTDGTTGDISLNYVLADKQLSISRTTGDVKFRDCDASDIHIRIDTGDVTGHLLSGKTFTAESGTGTVSVPGNSAGGTCVITASTGDIRISVG